MKAKDYSKLYIEGQENIPEQILGQISKATNLSVYNGIDTRIEYLPIVIDKIYKNLKEDLIKKEVLIICDDKEIIFKTMKSISKNVVFISQTGCNKDEEKEIYDYILEEYGISLFFPNNIEKTINNYSIIINFLDKINFDISRIKKNSIIFDFSKDNDIWIDKGISAINDFIFNINNFQINTILLESLDIDIYQEDMLLSVNRENYSIKKYINSYIKMKGQF